MKKTLFLLFTALAVVSCNDDCDHFGDSLDLDMVGSWYEETQNEEDTYSSTGTFYGRYCNKLTQGEGQGNYRYDSEQKRLSWSYHVNGMGMTDDWTIKDYSKHQFTMYSDKAILTYGKIVETYNMEGGSTQQIAFNELTVQGYESTNEHIATVSSSGLITATGEKGTVYIKVKCSGADVYVKVIVGEDYPDLWIDYSGLLGQDYATMKAMLGDPDKSEEAFGYSIYRYDFNWHNILDEMYVRISSDTHKINQIALFVNQGITKDKIMSYMDAHYYPYTVIGTQHYYTTSSKLRDARALYGVETDTTKTGTGGYSVFMLPTEDIAPWPSFKSYYGMNKEELQKAMNIKGYEFYLSMDSYSFDTSDAYLTSGEPSVYAVEFVYNPDKVVSQYWLYFMPGVDQNELYEKFLRDFYYEATEEYVESYGIIFYNRDKTQKVVLKPSTDIWTDGPKLIFTDLTKKPVDLVILNDYWKGVGMTRSQLIEKWGYPYQESNGRIIYAPMTDYITIVNFFVNSNTGKVNPVNVILREEVEAETVKAYLNRLYTFNVEEETEDGQVFRWLNAKTVEEADMRISYYPDYGVVAYAPYPIVSDPGPVPESEGIIPDYTNLIGETASQVINELGEPDRILGNTYAYQPQNHEFVKLCFVDFEDNPITDATLCKSVSVTLQDNHNQAKVLEFLNERYTSKSEYSFSSKDGSVAITYIPSSNSIIYIKSYGF